MHFTQAIIFIADAVYAGEPYYDHVDVWLDTRFCEL